MLRVLLLVILSQGIWAGVSPPDERIIGGTETSIENFPFQVSLQYIIFGHMCGATLYTNKWVITAAHCVYGSLPFLLKVRAGSNTVSGSGGISKMVFGYLTHPRFSPKLLDYDIALVRLAEGFELSSSIQPVQLPPEGFQLAPGAKVNVSGWGTLSEGGKTSDILNFVEVLTVSSESCSSSYPSITITDRMLCAGVPEGGKDSCRGDSGGPLTIGNMLVGIVSFGRGCARAGSPGVYANVSDLSSWVKSVVEQ